MKRVQILFIFAFGLALAFFSYFFFQGESFDVSGFWALLQSYFRKAETSVSESVNEVTGQSDPLSKAVSLVAGFEGFSAKAYPDAGGYSIGYGHFIRSGDPYTSTSAITEQEAFALLQQDVTGAYNCVSQNVEVPLSENQAAALISFVYNVGCAAFAGSTMLKLLNAGDYQGAAAQFPLWNKSKGVTLFALISRRASEQGVFLS